MRTLDEAAGLIERGFSLRMGAKGNPRRRRKAEELFQFILFKINILKSREGCLSGPSPPRFVDLFAVVRGGLIGSEANYSIKSMEAFYGRKREGAVAAVSRVGRLSQQCRSMFARWGLLSVRSVPTEA